MKNPCLRHTQIPHHTQRACLSPAPEPGRKPEHKPRSGQARSIPVWILVILLLCVRVGLLSSQEHGAGPSETVSVVISVARYAEIDGLDDLHFTILRPVTPPGTTILQSQSFTVCANFPYTVQTSEDRVVAVSGDGAELYLTVGAVIGDLFTFPRPEPAPGKTRYWTVYGVVGPEDAKYLPEGLEYALYGTYHATVTVVVLETQ
jgi:hypothetical protein